jgi:calcineurin-like phosphoesterase family protein
MERTLVRRIATNTLTLLALLSVACLAGPASATEGSSRWEWDGVARVVAVGDVHGSPGNLILILKSSGLLDGNLAWTGGASHLVLNGDLIDRGWSDRGVLDLARRLQSEAEAAGGRVHVVLGNHEAMNLNGNLRYVSKESFAEFADLEKQSHREKAWMAFKDGYRRDQILLLRKAFDEQHPPGYFGRRRALAPDGEYGSWLLLQPAAIKINGIVFVHGGLTPKSAAKGLNGINEEVHRTLRTGSRPSDWNQGPLWYRGNSLQNERIERVPLAQVLESLDARALVVAHTPTGSHRVTSRFNGTLYRTDVGMAYGARPQALVFEQEEAWAFDPATFGRSRPLLEAPQGEHWSGIYTELQDEFLEKFLAKAKIVERHDLQRGSRHFSVLELHKDGLDLRAVFQFVEEKPAASTPPESVNPRRYQHEVAAYRLSRELGLDIVPVTVPREVDGKRGAISIWPEAAIDLPYIRAHGRWELLQGLEARVSTARIFTALIGTRDRADGAKMLLPPERRILVADNSKGFPLNLDVEDFLVTEIEGFRFDPCALDASLEFELRTLNADRLKTLLGGLLSNEQIEALVQRRNRVISTCASREEAKAAGWRAPSN